MKECTDYLNRLSEDWAGINSCRSNKVTLESGDGADVDCWVGGGNNLWFRNCRKAESEENKTGFSDTFYNR